MTQKEEIERIKRIVLEHISAGLTYIASGRSKYRIGNSVVHMRICSTYISRNPRYKFNINPYTLTANYEVWICGDAYTYYIIPTEVMRLIYNNPTTYPDRRNPGYFIVSVNVEKHELTYASGGETLLIDEYFGGTL